MDVCYSAQEADLLAYEWENVKKADDDVGLNNSSYDLAILTEYSHKEININHISPR